MWGKISHRAKKSVAKSLLIVRYTQSKMLSRQQNSINILVASYVFYVDAISG